MAAARKQPEESIGRASALAPAEFSGDVFYITKDGYEGHIQVKTTATENASPAQLFALLDTVYRNLADIGAKPRPEKTYGAKAPAARNYAKPEADKTPMEAAAEDTFERASSAIPEHLECKNGCGPMKRINNTKGSRNRYGEVWKPFFTCDRCSHKVNF